MKKKLHYEISKSIVGLGIALLVLSSEMHAQITTDPVIITSGFNQDIIANGEGYASTSTTIGFDETNTRALVSLDFQADSFSDTPTYGLPVDGTINSMNTTGVTFQLADYNNENVLFLTPSYVGNGAPESGTLSFEAANINTIYLLAGATGGGNQSLSFSATVLFSDATTQTEDLTVNDWYNGPDAAIMGIGRVNTSTDVLEGNETNPRLYELSISLEEDNHAKTITGITFNFEGDVLAEWADEIRLSVLAVSTLTAELGLPDIQQNQFALYPNPADGVVYLKTETPLKSVALYNGLGQEVLRSGQGQLDTQDLPTGIYMVMAEFEDGSVKTEKLVKK